MKIKLLFVYTISILLMLTACSAKQNIDTGISLSNQYIELHTKYQNVYSNVDIKTKEFMKKNIAPKINQLKHDIIQFNDKSLEKESVEKLDIQERIDNINKQLEEINNGK